MSEISSIRTCSLCSCCEWRIHLTDRSDHVFCHITLFDVEMFHVFQEQSRRQLEETLRRAAVACYAAQGAYPPDLNYIEEHWGVQIDRSRYAVFYQVEGSNLMPDITVLERET